MGYSWRKVMEVEQTSEFVEWVTRLADTQARLRVVQRVDRLSLGNPGDSHAVGGGVMELRIDYGPGYRVYYTRFKRTVVLLLCGGTKKGQQGDIDRAIEMARQLKKVR